MQNRVVVGETVKGETERPKQPRDVHTSQRHLEPPHCDVQAALVCHRKAPASEAQRQIQPRPFGDITWPLLSINRDPKIEIFQAQLAVANRELHPPESGAGGKVAGRV